VSGVLLRCRLYLDLGRVRLAVEFPFTRPHARHEPPNSLCPGQQSTDRRGFGDDTNIRPAAGIVDEHPVGSASHAVRLYTFERQHAA
jgi:hypothetical protein